MIYAMWNEGNGYGPSDLVTDLEGFGSMADVSAALTARRDHGYRVVSFGPRGGVSAERA